ncbi:MAG: T6SS immunity protein Tdi1 domain-containing protein [Bacteroidia bacterium]
MTKVAENLEDLKRLLKIQDNYDNWFLSWLHPEIENSGIKLKDNEVFSFNKMPALGGEYTFDNIEPVDISVHFHLTGEICRQIKDLPDGTKVNVKADK